MTDTAERLRITDIPIPDDVQPDTSWSQLLLEIAEIIGPRDTLRLVDAIGGREVYFAKSGPMPELLQLFGNEKAEALNYHFMGDWFELPTAKLALTRARRGAIIAAVRDEKMTAGQGASILNIGTRYMRHLVKRGEEGQDAVPLLLKRKVDPRQIDMFPDNND